MARPSTGTAQTSGFALTLHCATAVVEFATVAVAGAWSDDVADASPFGQGTTAAAAALAAVTILGTIAARIGMSGSARMAAGILVAVGAGLAAMMALFFLIAGSTFVFALLLAHATFSTILIARALLQPPAKARS